MGISCYKCKMSTINVFYMLLDRQPYAIQAIVGPVVTYASVICNAVIFLALSAKHLNSSSTILLQGLAIFDGLTSLCVYGFEPFFTSKYVSFVDSFIILNYPFCILHFHIIHAEEAFHLGSVLITSFLGIQKFISIKFPFFSRRQFSRKSSIIIISLCAVFTVFIHIPLHLTLKFADNDPDQIWNRTYTIHFEDSKVSYSSKYVCEYAVPDDILRLYTLRYYPILIVSLLVMAVLSMLVTTIYITYYLHKSRFSGRINFSQRRNRKSVKMVLIVLVTFLFSEVPRLFLNVVLLMAPTFQREASTWIADMFISDPNSYRILALQETLFPSADYVDMKDLSEIIRLLTVVGCLSNFIIYILMSERLHTTLKNKLCCCCT